MISRSITWLAVAGVAIVIGALAWALFEFHSLAPPDWDELQARIRREFPDVSHLELADLDREAETREIVFIDVRDPVEVAVSRIPGAVVVHQITPEFVAELQSASDGGPNADPVPGRQRIHVFYCSVGYRSAQAVREASRLGLPEAHNFLGSIFAWANAGRSLAPGPRDEALGSGTDGASPPVHVHPYNQFWGELLDERHRAELTPSEPR